MKSRSRIFQTSLRAEFTGVALSVFVVLLAITLITMLIRLLGQAASGTLAVEGVAAMLGFTVLNYLPVLLSLTLFISVLLTLMRCYRDSEMVVWFSAGLSLTAWLRPVLSFALPMVATIALVSMVLSPWALSKSDELKRQLESRDDVTTASPGVFRESKHADRVYFVEPIAGDKARVANVFVQSVQHGKMGTMIAAQGLQETFANGDRFLVLLKGARYEGLIGSPEYKITYFDRYAMRIEAQEIKQGITPVKSMNTLELLQDSTPLKMSELEWRLGLPVSALILVLFAIPLSFINPRGGRSFNLILALLLYMVYNNLHSVVTVWVAQSKVPLTLGLWAVHSAMLVILLLFFYHRLSVFSLTRWLNSRRNSSL